MENKNSELRRRANLKRDIERQTDLTNHGFSPILVAIHSFICQICRLIDMHKRHVFGLFFFLLETGAAVLDGIGKGKSDLLLAAFVLSTIGFLITCCACVKRRARSTSTIEVPAVRQLRLVELVFSSIQLIASLLQFLLSRLKDNKILDAKNNIDASVFPVAFAMVAVVFIFKNDEAITNSSQEGSQQQVTVDRTGTSARNEDSPSISDIIPESSSATELPANNVPQEGSQQQIKRDLIETARNQDRPDKMTESSSATVLPGNNVPQEGSQQQVKRDLIEISRNQDRPYKITESCSATVLPPNNVPQEGSQQQVKHDLIETARNQDRPYKITESSSTTVLPANNVPQEGSQQQVKRDLIETSRNQDRPEKMTESSSATVVPANNVPRSRGLTFRKVVTQVLKMSSSSATVLPANNVPPTGRLTFAEVVAQVLRMSSSSTITSTSNSPSADKSD